MADLNFRAQIELLDKMTAPMRSISSQADRLGRQFGETAKEAKKLQSQQRLVDSFKQQKHALAETSEAAQRSRMRLADLQRQMQATTNPTASLVRQFEAAGRESQRLNTRLDSQRQHLQQLRGRLSDAGIDTRRLSDHERELARQIERTNQQLGEQRRRLGEVRRLEQQSNQMRDMRGKAAGLAFGGAAATYAGARVIQPGLEFESEMSRVQAVTRLDKNSDQYKMLEAQARMLGSTTSFTQANAAQGQKFLAMAGFTPESIKAAMPGMLNLALAGDMDLASTADIASNILSGMNLQSSEMTNVADVLTAAFTRANVDIGMLGETMKYAAPGAAGLNISLQEVAAMAGKLGDAGMQGSMGGTALRAIMLRMAAPPKAAAEALDRLGISTTDASGDLRAMPDILKDVYEQTKNLGNAEQLEIFSKISGVEASNAMKVLVDQAGNGELQKMVTTLKSANGEAANVATTMSDNTMGDWAATTSAIDAFRTMLFDTNGGALREFLQSVTTLTQRLTAFGNANPELISMLGKLFATLAIGAVIIGGIGVVMLTILGPMALLRASLVTLGGMSGIFSSFMGPLKLLWALFGFVGKAVVSAVALIGKSLLGIVKVMRVVGAVMMANPILIVIAIIAAAAYLIYKNWDTLGPKFAALWERIKATFSNALTAITTYFSTKWEAVKAYTSQLWEGIKTRFNNGITAVINFVTGFGTRLLLTLQTAWTTIVTAVSQLWTFISTAFTNGIMIVINFVMGFGARLLSVLQAAWTALTTATTQLWSRIKALFTGGIASLIAALLSFSPAGLFIRAFAAVWPYLAGLGAKFKQYGINMLDGLKNGILAKAQSVINSISSVVSRVKGAFTGSKGMDIHSPSRVFAKYGGFVMSGLANGIDADADAPFGAMQKVTRALANQPIVKLNTAMSDTIPAPLTKATLDIDTTALDALGARQFTVHAKVDTDTSKLSTLWGAVKRLPLPSNLMRAVANHSPINMDTITSAGRYIKRSGNTNDGIITQPPINLDRRRTVLPNSATMGNCGSSGAMSMGNITINIQGAADPHATAQMVRAEMERIRRDDAARFRSRLSDID